MTAPTLFYLARLDWSVAWRDSDLTGSWFITHPLGSPAEGSYTEIAFADDSLIGVPDDPAIVATVLEELTRRVAVDLYGSAWAFIYRPEQYEDAVARWGMRRRERVIVSTVEVLSLPVPLDFPEQTSL